MGGKEKDGKGKEKEGDGKGGQEEGRGGDVEGPGKWSAPGPTLALGGPAEMFFISNISIVVSTVYCRVRPE